MSQYPPNDFDQPMGTCDITGQAVPASEMIEFQGYLVCAEGKQILMERLQAGESLSVDALHDPGWRTTRTGLSTIYKSYIAIVISVVIMIVIMIPILIAAGTRGGPGPAMGLIAIPVIIMLIALIAILVGKIMCIAIPQESGAKGLITAAFICFVIALLTGIINGVTSSETATGGTIAIGLLGNLLQIAESILFILFLKKVAVYLNEPQLAKSASNLLIFGICVFVGLFVFGVIAGMSQSPAILSILGTAMVVCTLVLFIWWLRVIKKVRDAIAVRI